MDAALNMATLHNDDDIECGSTVSRDDSGRGNSDIDSEPMISAQHRQNMNYSLASCRATMTPPVPENDAMHSDVIISRSANGAKATTSATCKALSTFTNSYCHVNMTNLPQPGKHVERVSPFNDISVKSSNNSHLTSANSHAMVDCVDESTSETSSVSSVQTAASQIINRNVRGVTNGRGAADSRSELNGAAT